MRFSHIKQSVLTQFAAPNGNAIVPFIMGAPGGGKSACAREIVREMGIENVVEFTASLRDPVDILGTPNNTGEYTRWVPPEEFWRLRKGVGRCALILEEISDASVPMQNALCGVIYDRRAGNLQLSDDLFIIATGNRVKDKSGANRITSKLAGRVRLFEFQENLEDWEGWARDNGVSQRLIQFLRYRPALLSDFDPDRFANPTPRTWARVALIPDESLPEDLYFSNVCGEVGEGAAAEWCAFRRIYDGLPKIDAIIASPDEVHVPQEPATKYALVGALAEHATAENFAAVLQYLQRLEPEFCVLCVKDAVRKTPSIAKTDAFKGWGAKYAQLFV